MYIIITNYTCGYSVCNCLLGVGAELPSTGDHCRVSNIPVMSNFNVQQVWHACHLPPAAAKHGMAQIGAQVLFRREGAIDIVI